MEASGTGITTFNYSQDVIKQKYRVTITSALCMPVAMMAFAFFIPEITYGVALVTILVGESILFFQSRRMLKQFGDMKLLLDNEIIERKSGEFSEQYKLAEITGLIVNQDRNKRTLSVRLKMGKREVILAGFEGMDKLSDLLVNKLAPELVSFKEIKSVQINYSLIVVAAALSTTIIIISLVRANEYTYDLFSSAFQMLLGLFFLLFAPISKVSGIRYRKFEIVGGGLLAVIGAALLIVEWSGV